MTVPGFCLRCGSLGNTLDSAWGAADQTEIANDRKEQIT